MSALDQDEGSDEPNTSTPIVGEDKRKPIEEKLLLDPVSMSKKNGVTPNGSKRKRKDWRAFANENGRRSLRSDMARLLADTEAGVQKGAETRVSISELEAVDSVECQDNSQAEGTGQLKAKVNKGSDECDVGSVSCKEVTKIGECGQPSNGVLGAGEMKESDDAINGISGTDFPSEKEVEKLKGTIGKEVTQLLDGTQPEGTDDGGNAEELEGKGGGTEDEVTVVSDKVGTENIECGTGEVDVSYENSKGAIGMETLKVETEPTDVQGKGLAEAEEKVNECTQFNVPKGTKKKVFTTKKRTPVQVESVIVERRITRSSAAKQKWNDENATQTEGTATIEEKMEEENSGLDQTDTDNNEFLKTFKHKKNKKVRSDRIKSSDLMDSDEDFNPVKERLRQKKKEEGDGDRSVPQGAKREPPSKRKKLKMDKDDTEEVSIVVRRRDGPKKPKVESEESDSSSYRMERLKRKEPKIERDGSDPNSDFLGSDQETAPVIKRRGRPPGSKIKTEESKFGKTIKKKNERRAQPLGSKSTTELDNKPGKIRNLKKGKKVVKVESLSELDNKPRKEAKDIVSGMIKDLLSQHGWTIEMRPRNGRNYVDQVHVAPDGSTHWSVTNAYNHFLKKMKSSQSPSKGKQVADFTPIPEELLGLLKRSICKERSDAGKRNKLKGNKKGKLLGVKSKKIMKKEKLKKKNKKEGLKPASNGTNEMDASLSAVSKKSNTGRGRKKKARLTLLARGSHEGEASGENDYVPYEWKRTVLSWMIDLDAVSENDKVKYIDSNKPDPLAQGKIIRDGIKCDCCGKTFTVCDFGVHAGAENGSSFLSKLVLEEAGVCLLQCLLQAWEKQCKISEPKGFFLSAEANGVDQNDDTCGVCGDGGDLVCCDKCPSTFHLGCLGMEMLPSGDWHCPYCSCAFCTKLSSSPLLSCTQCNGRFHSSCVPEKNGISVHRDDGIPFCGESCKKLFKGLEAILGVNHKMEGGFSWRLVRHITEDEISMDPLHTLEVQAECNSKISVAMTVMDECFLPIDDQRSGIDLLRNVVYSCKSNFVRLNFKGFYTFLLEREDEIICVASVRVHGNKLAEMPFIGTRYMYRRQGMCRRLLDGIESALSSLTVEKLVIPAITELVDTWTNVFGFRPLEGPERQELRSKSIVVFPGTGLLQKSMLGTGSKEDCSTSPAEATVKILESSKNQQSPVGDMLHEFTDASCADLKPDDSGEGSSNATASGEGLLSGPSNLDSDVVQSVKPYGDSAESDAVPANTVQSDKAYDKPAELESDMVPAVQEHEGLAEPVSGSVLAKGMTPGKTKVLHGADGMGPLGSGENGGLQGCAENGVHRLTGVQLASTDAVMASAAN